jgi:hypothetical protein
MKSGHLNFLEPSGPLQACNGSVLSLPLPLQHSELDLKSLVNIPIKFALEQATKAQTGSRGISLLFNLGSKGDGWSAPRPGRFTPGKTRYPFYGRLGGPQGQSGQVRKISPPPEFDPRTVYPIASRYTD